MKKNVEEVHDLYCKEASRSGLSGRCTMPDEGVRELEISVLSKYVSKVSILRERTTILEIGCGNGYTVSLLADSHKNCEFIAVDSNEEMIKLASQRNLSNVTFIKMSALSLELEKKVDLVYTERCLMNLISWENQQIALKEIARVMNPQAILVLIETFCSGWEKLNKSREILGLPEIPIPPQSTPYEDATFETFIKKGFIKSNLLEGNDENFLSTYYYGARILYPALIAGKTDLVYNNPFIEMFKYLPPILNYSPVQLRILERTGSWAK